jgi:hypothetical protein
MLKNHVHESPWGSPRLIVLPLLLALLALTGCASISVQPHSESAARAVAPKLIYVAEFSTADGDFRVDREKVELRDFKTNLRALLQMAMVRDLTRRLVPAQDARHGEALPHEDSWLVRGEFVRVNQGSRLLRGTIGFGLGGTKLVTKVQVYDLNSQDSAPFLTFRTTGGSNAEPGAITGIATDPLTLGIGVVVGGAGGVAHGLTEDSARTAREITAMLSDYMFRHLMIDADKWIHPKVKSPPLPHSSDS